MTNDTMLQINDQQTQLTNLDVIDTNVITVDEFPSKDTVDRFDIRNIAMNQIFEFLNGKEYCQKYTLKLSSDMHLSDILDLSAREIYRHYGITCTDDSFDTINIPAALLAIPGEMLVSFETLENYRQQELAKITGDCAFFASSILMLNAQQQQDWYQTAIEQNEEDTNKILGLLKELGCYNLRVVVDDSIQYSSMIDRYRAYNSELNPDIFDIVNVDDLFVKYNCFTGHHPANMLNLQNIIKEMIKIIETNEKTKSRSFGVFFTTNLIYQLDNESLHALLPNVSKSAFILLWTSIAAYMTLKYNAHFDIPKELELKVLQRMQQIFSPRYNYVENTIKYLLNLPQVTIAAKNNFSSYCILDKASLARSITQGIRAVIAYLPLDNLADAEVMRETVDIKELNIIPFNTMFNLHTTDYEAARIELDRLSKLLHIFDERLELTKTNACLNINNTCFCDIDGKQCIVYVASLTGELPFICFPLINKTKPFKINLPLVEVYELHDIRLNDIHRINTPTFREIFRRDVQMREFYRELNDTAEGVLLLGLHTDPGKIISGDGTDLHFDTVGIWNRISSDLRGQNLNSLASCIPLRGLKMHLLSFFGGPHPYITKDFHIDQDLWK